VKRQCWAAISTTISSSRRYRAGARCPETALPGEEGLCWVHLQVHRFRARALQRSTVNNSHLDKAYSK
jgi:hypothetical protein